MIFFDVVFHIAGNSCQLIVHLDIDLSNSFKVMLFFNVVEDGQIYLYSGRSVYIHRIANTNLASEYIHDVSAICLYIQSGK